MKNRDDALLRRIVEYCKEVEDAVDFFGDEEEFKKNKIYRNAVCMPVMQIGELCKLVSDETREANSYIDWRGWCGIRDIMAHQYTNLDYKKTWVIIEADLPKLKSYILKLLCEIDEISIKRINQVICDYKLGSVNANDVYHRIVDDTGISLNMFSDEKIVEFIKKMM